MLFLTTPASDELSKLSSAAVEVIAVVFPLEPNNNVPIFISFMWEFESVTIAFDADNDPSVTPMILSASTDVKVDAPRSKLLSLR